MSAPCPVRSVPEGLPRRHQGESETLQLLGEQVRILKQALACQPRTVRKKCRICLYCPGNLADTCINPPDRRSCSTDASAIRRIIPLNCSIMDTISPRSRMDFCAYIRPVRADSTEASISASYLLQTGRFPGQGYAPRPRQRQTLCRGTRTGGFHRGVQREEIGLERNAVDDFDDGCDFIDCSSIWATTESRLRMFSSVSRTIGCIWSDSFLALCTPCALLLIFSDILDVISH
jgi:hypothetical protein